MLPLRGVLSPSLNRLFLAFAGLLCSLFPDRTLRSALHRCSPGFSLLSPGPLRLLFPDRTLHSALHRCSPGFRSSVFPPLSLAVLRFWRFRSGSCHLFLGRLRFPFRLAIFALRSPGARFFPLCCCLRYCPLRPSLLPVVQALPLWFFPVLTAPASAFCRRISRSVPREWHRPPLTRASPGTMPCRTGRA